jgi:hypothetical protein
VFFATAGFSVTNLAAGTEARAERSTADIVLAHCRLETILGSRAAESTKRGHRCRDLEGLEQDAIRSLERLRADVKQDANPQGCRTRHQLCPTACRPGPWLRCACSPVWIPVCKVETSRRAAACGQTLFLSELI